MFIATVSLTNNKQLSCLNRQSEFTRLVSLIIVTTIIIVMLILYYPRLEAIMLPNNALAVIENKRKLQLSDNVVVLSQAIRLIVMTERFQRILAKSLHAETICTLLRLLQKKPTTWRSSSLKLRTDLRRRPAHPGCRSFRFLVLIVCCWTQRIERDEFGN